jgi:hypothetical protein
MNSAFNLMGCRPGFHPRRLVKLMRDAIERCELDLSGKVVLTEAATGAYVVTPVLAAMAGAEEVHALANTSAYGTVEEVTVQTQAVAAAAGVTGRILIKKNKSRDIVRRADIITNSGHVRPINAEMVSWMKPGAVVPLMYEAWEFREGDIDLDACREYGIKVAGTNERHPAVDVFSFLGIMAVKLLLDAGMAVWGNRFLLLCDNAFAPYIERGMRSAGAEVTVGPTLTNSGSGEVADWYDAIVVAIKPGPQPIVGSVHNSLFPAERINANWPGAVVTQFWGDFDREELEAKKMPYWPIAAVPRGQMGILPSGVGPEPVVRLQCGGLKVGEILSRIDRDLTAADLAFLEMM